MKDLFFSNPISTITTVFVLAVLAIIAASVIKNKKVKKWGRLVLITILLGTAISGLSATRDGFMMENSLFALKSMQVLMCSAAGAIIFLTGLITLFIRKQNFRKISFYIVSALFVIQVITIEVSRIIMN